MKREIAFQTAPTNAPSPIAPREASGPTWQDNTFLPQFKDRTLKFKQKLTWLRFLPAITGSQYTWLMPFGQIKDDEGRFPAFVDPAFAGQPSVFNHAQNWLRKNAPEQLRKKDVNPRGFKMYPAKRGIAWAIVDGAPEGERLKLLHVSLYDGQFGGAPGMGHRLFDLAESVDNEPGSPTIGQKIYGDITHPETGRLVKIDKTDGGEFANYNVGMGTKVAPLDLEGLTDEEHNLICPLEKTLAIPTEEEQKGYLRRLVGEKLFNQIFP